MCIMGKSNFFYIRKGWEKNGDVFGERSPLLLLLEFEARMRNMWERAAQVGGEYSGQK